MPGAAPPALTVLIPGLPSVSSTARASGQWPAKILRALRQASKSGLGSTANSNAVFDAFGLDNDQCAVPYQALGLFGEDQARGYWMGVEPIHLHPDRDHLLVFDHTGLALQPEEAQSFVNSLNETYQDEDWAFHVLNTSQWLLKVPAFYELTTEPLSDIVGQSLMRHLPTGPDAPLFINRLNEIQMLFHAHSANAAREAQDQSTISGVWLSGLSRLPEGTAIHPPFDQVISNEPLSRGLAIHSGVEPISLPAEIQNALADFAEGNILIDFGVHDFDQSVECLRLAIEALRQKRYSVLNVYLGDGCVYHLKPWQHLKFWVGT